MSSTPEIITLSSIIQNIITLQTQIRTIQTDISNVSGLSSLQTQIKTIQTDISNVSGLSSLQTQIKTIQTDISNVSGLSSLQTQIRTIDEKNNSLLTAINTLKNSITENGSSDLILQIKDMKKNIINLQDDIISKPSYIYIYIVYILLFLEFLLLIFVLFKN
jgi:TolA-binding protein